MGLVTSEQVVQRSIDLILTHREECSIEHSSLFQTQLITTKTMLKTISMQITLLVIFLASCSNIQPAQAMTADEFLRMMGVLGRYADDLNKTFGPNRQPDSMPSPKPAQPQPNQQDTVPVPLDQLMEQLPNFN